MASIAEAMTNPDLLEIITKQADVGGLGRAKLMATLRQVFKGLKDLAPSSEERVARELIHPVMWSRRGQFKRMLKDKLCINPYQRRELRAFRKHDPYPRGKKYSHTIVPNDWGFEWAVQVLNELGGWDGLAERRERRERLVRRQQLERAYNEEEEDHGVICLYSFD